MKSRGVVGKRIVAVEQAVRNPRISGRRRVACVDALVLEDGTRLVPVVQENDFAEYWVDLVVSRPRKSKRKVGPPEATT